MPKTTHDLGLKTSIQIFDAFVRCTLIRNQPWPQFQNGIRVRSIYWRKHCNRSVATVLASVALKRFGHWAILKMFFSKSPRFAVQKRPRSNCNSTFRSLLILVSNPLLLLSKDAISGKINRNSPFLMRERIHSIRDSRNSEILHCIEVKWCRVDANFIFCWFFFILL